MSLLFSFRVFVIGGLTFLWWVMFVVFWWVIILFNGGILKKGDRV